MPTGLTASQVTVLAYLDAFCRADVDALEALLSEDCRFEGPFARFDRRAAYVAALREDPPEPATYELLACFGSGDAVGVFCDYRKPGVTSRMALLCSVRGRHIASIRLVFDTRDFA